MAEGSRPRGGRLSGIVPLVVILVVVVLFLRSCWQEIGPNLGLSQGSTEERDLDAPTEPAPGDTAPEGEAGEDPGAPSAVTRPREPECPAEDGSSERHLQWTAPPPTCIDPDASHTATLHTSQGDVEIDLDTEGAPVTVNNFVFLARWHFYDGVEFHAIFPGVSAQTGDPLGSGSTAATAGYTFEGEVPEDGSYPLYSVAMGNAGSPDTSSSVFFIVTGTEARREPIYARFGQVSDPESQRVVRAIDDTGHPRRPEDPDPVTVIESVTIEEG